MDAPSAYVTPSYSLPLLCASRNTGRVEWRLGGRRPELSSFKIKDDPNGVFSGQHDARITKQGLLTMFDNSVRTGSRTARAVDYALEWEDDSPAIARQVSVFNTGVSAFAKGSYRRMPNGAFRHSQTYLWSLWASDHGI